MASRLHEDLRDLRIEVIVYASFAAILAGTIWLGVKQIMPVAALVVVSTTCIALVISAGVRAGMKSNESLMEKGR